MKKNTVCLFVFCLAVLFLFSACGYQEQELKSAYERVFSAYQQKLKQDPEDEQTRLRFARFCYDFKDYRQVVALLKDTEDTEGRLVLAKAYARLNQYTLALESFDAVQAGISDQEGLYFYGLVLEKKNLYPQALQVYAKVRGEFKAKAAERISAIEDTVKSEVPDYLQELSQSAVQFISESKEEAAVLLSVDEKIQVMDDHTSVTTLHVIEKVLKERGKEIAEVELGYDSTYERVELEFARTITDQGLIISAGKKNIRDVTKYLNFPLYSNSRAFIISMPAVDVGAIIEYKVKIYSAKLINEKDLSLIYRLREKYPVFKSRFCLDLPAEMKMKYTFVNQQLSSNISLDPVQEKKGDRELFAWEFSRIKPIIPEYNMPPVSMVNPAVLLSSFDSWQEIFVWWQTLYSDKLELNKEMEKKLAELVAGTKDDYEKAKKIYEYVSRNIRYVAVEYGESGHEPHKAAEVFLNRYGDCKDQAVLLTALFRAAGLEGMPVLIPTREAYDVLQNFPSVNFNHAIAAVRIDDEIIFCDPTSETTAFKDLPAGDQDRTVLVFFPDGYKLMRTPELNTSELMVNMDIFIDAQENAEIYRSVKSRGGYSAWQRYYLKYSHPSKIRQNLENKMMAISPFSFLLEYKIENVDDFDAVPGLWYRFRTEKFLNPSQNLRVIPPLNQCDLSPSLIAGETRKFPIDFSELSSRKAKISLHLPQNLAIKYLPEDHVIDTPWFIFSVKYKEQDEKLDFFQEFRVKQRFVQPEVYPEFREKMKEVFYLLREVVLFEKKQ